MMDVAKIMTKAVRTCRADESLQRAASQLWEHDCGCVPVVDEREHVVGMLTDRDICMASYFHDVPLSQLRVHEAMAKKITTCRPTDSIEVAEQLMQSIQVRRLPVIDDEGKLVGLLSLNDIARFARTPVGQKNVDRLTATLAAVCAPRARAPKSDGAAVA